MRMPKSRSEDPRRRRVNYRLRGSNDDRRLASIFRTCREFIGRKITA